MKRINEFTVLSKILEFNANIQFWLVENDARSTYEVLTIRANDKYKNLIERLIKGELKPLENEAFIGVHPIRSVGYSDEEACYFIVYNELEDYRFLSQAKEWTNARSILDIAQGLNLLKKQNRQNYFITPSNIRINSKGEGKLCFVGLFDLFKQQGLLQETYIAPNVLAWLEDRKQPKPNFQDDIYALIKSFEFVLREQIGNGIALSILTKALDEERINRYPKYHELISCLEELPVHIHNQEERSTVKVVFDKKVSRDLKEKLLASMNRNTWLKLDQERSKKNNAMGGRYSTSDWNGKFIVDIKGYLFIRYINEGRNEGLITNQQSFIADFTFSPYSSSYKIIPFFEEKLNEINQLTNLNYKKRNLVRQWRALPDKEREFIEEQAFKAKYIKRQAVSNADNIDFELDGLERKSWTRVNDLRKKKVVLFIDGQRIGRILNYKMDEQIITITDTYCSIDEISPQGELTEDIQQETSQYKKQVEACDRFKESDIANPIICDILATPEKTTMPYNSILEEEDYEDFDAHIYNPHIRSDQTQKEAVLEALTYKPLYLIQGPPGTGKTTVIVELIQQILRKQKDAKILVTSQSNLAVDNVLDKIDVINKTRTKDLSFMRLASSHALEKDSIKESIQVHTFENKLKKWVENTIKRSEENLTLKFPKASKNKELQYVYADFLNKNWKSFTNSLRFKNSYIKNLFERVESKEKAQQVFEKELGKEFIALLQIQKDWFSFLAGTTVEDSKNKQRKISMLNDGSTEIDFLTAMMREVNIIGATCIHIASSQYSNINFRFDYVIMDESSKASPPETLVPLNMGQNIILIGDHKQLPPVVTRENAIKSKVKEELQDNGLDFNKEFGMSLFEHLINAFENDDSKNQYIKMLNIQYRMPKQVGRLISKYFYNSNLKNPSDLVIPDYDNTKAHGLNLKANTSILFISTSNEPQPYDNNDKFKRKNFCNLKKIQSILVELNELYANNLDKENPFTIGVIAGYRGQVELLKKKINESDYDNFVLKKGNNLKESKNLISIDTVDQFQGAEQDIIIYDIVRSSMGESNIGFLDDYRRINVAFSRVKKLLIVVGDIEYLINRATLNSKGDFKEFKLQQIAEELKEKGYVFNTIKEALKEVD